MSAYNICSEDAMMLLVRRVESLAISSAGKERIEREARDLRQRLDQSSVNATSLRSDLAAAESKIAEWAEYASALRSAIDAIDPKALKRKRIVLPDMPKPLETDIPF